MAEYSCHVHNKEFDSHLEFLSHIRDFHESAIDAVESSDDADMWDIAYEIWKLVNSGWMFPGKRRAFHDQLARLRTLSRAATVRNQK